MISIDLSSKKALVTGGSRGIGKAISLRLAEAGCDVALNYLKESKDAGKITGKIKTIGRQAISIKADIRDHDAVKDMVSEVIGDFGTIDILINNSGVTDVSNIEDLDIGQWKRVIDTNLSGAFYVSKYCLGFMKKKRYGKIVNISSVATLTGRGGGVHYASSKGGMDAMTRALAREAAPYNIRVNGIAPAVIETDFYYNRYPDYKEREEVLKGIPVGRIGKPLDVANICVFLCSDLADYISGETIIADGGRTFTGG